ncbi:hypothetical protein B0H34DRAFT_800875 [Crassisporium funariophilum]|nr:hypothetical protein B0H34DRAFT_800875 [Crassisporium funariophilum]
MSTRAIARHRIAEAPNTQIPTFDEWTAQRGGLGAEERDFIGQSEADGDEDEEDEEEDRDEPLGPRKRRRIDGSPPPDISNDILETRSLSSNVTDRSDHVLPQDTEPPNKSQDRRRTSRTRGPVPARTPEPDIVGNDPEAHAQEDPVFSRIEHLHFAQEFIAEVSHATLNNGGLDDVVIDYLRHPEEGPVDISDPDMRFLLAIFLSCRNTSEQTYIDFRDATLMCYPNSNILLYHKVKDLVAKITGVRSFNDDMCINGCHALTGPYADLEACRVCFEPQYNPEEFASSGKKVPRQQASTILLGPQLQARCQSPLESHAIKYRDQKVAEIIQVFNAANSLDELVYDDIFCGNNILDHCETLSKDDMTVVFSIDGPQLYQDKKSDTWIAI